MARTFLDEVRLTAVPSAAGNYLTLSSNGTISQRTQSQVKSALGVTALEGRSIIAGTGLTGGGTLTSDVNMSVVYGTTTGTSAEGNTVVRVSGAQTVAGVKTFSSIPVLPATSPTTATQAATKGYVDAQVSSVNTGVMTLTGGSGVTVTGTSTATVSVDTTVVRTTGNQTLGGTKTFSTIPELPDSNPTTGNQAVRKAYVDAQITSVNTGVLSVGAGTGVTVGGTPTDPSVAVNYGTTAGTAAQGNDSRIVNAVQNTGNSNIGGVKTFTSIPVLPSTNPTSDNQAARKGYVDAQVSAVDTGVMSVSAGTGTTVGGTATNRTVNVTYGTAANTAAQGNDSRIVNAVPNSRSVTAGTGLTGGGDLSADRTLAVDGTVVRTTGSQSISGAKTFTDTVIVPAPALATHATTKTYVDQRSLPPGGAAGQVAAKASSSDYDAEWIDPPAGGVQSDDVEYIVELTQAEYDSLASPDPETLYIITDAEEPEIVLKDGSVTTPKLADNAVTPAKTERLGYRTVTASPALALGDVDGVVEVNSASAQTVTVPTDASVAFPGGTVIEIVRWGTGAVTISPASGVSLRSPDGEMGARTIASQYGSAFLRKRGTNNWHLSGDLE